MFESEIKRLVRWSKWYVQWSFLDWEEIRRVEWRSKEAKCVFRYEIERFLSMSIRATSTLANFLFLAMETTEAAKLQTRENHFEREQATPVPAWLYTGSRIIRCTATGPGSLNKQTLSDFNNLAVLFELAVDNASWQSTTLADVQIGKGSVWAERLAELG